MTRSAPDRPERFMTEFLASSEETVRRLAGVLDQLRTASSAPAAIDSLRFGFHSLYGNSSFLPGCPLTSLASAAEDALEAAGDGRIDPRGLVAPLAQALGCVESRLEEYRRGVSPVVPCDREAEITLLLRAASEGR